jgi:hypothetical protein
MHARMTPRRALAARGHVALMGRLDVARAAPSQDISTVAPDHGHCWPGPSRVASPIKLGRTLTFAF